MIDPYDVIAEARGYVDSADTADDSENPQVNGGAERQWPLLTHVDSADTEVLPRSSGRYPRPLWAMVDATAEAFQVDRSMVFLFILAVLSAATGGRRDLQVRQDWCEQVVLYTVTVAAPSERKSPVVRRLKQPLRDVERKGKAWVAAMRSDYTARISNVERALHDATDEEKKKELTTKLDELRAALAAVPAPVQMLADNVTPQKLAVEMAAQDGRMAVLTPEGAELFGMLVAPSGQSAAAVGLSLGVYLKGYTGEPHLESRITRQGVEIDRPALSLGVMVQPAVMSALAGESMLRGTGLLARFLYAQPESQVGHRLIEPPPIPDRVGARFDAAVTALAEQVHPGEVSTMTLTPVAYKRLMEFAQDVEIRLRPEDGDLDPVAEWAGKLPGQIARIAALLTLFARPAASEVDEQAVAEAVDLAPFLVAGAKRVADVTSGRDVLREHPRAIVDTIRRNDWISFTPRKVQRSLNKPWVNADTIRAALAELEDLGYIRRANPHVRRGPAANVYDVNPEVHA